MKKQKTQVGQKTLINFFKKPQEEKKEEVQ